jgi:putative addiction module component (TIGR02574 family)
MSTFEEILKAAYALSPGARAMLADHLLESLDDEAQKRIDAMWAEEAERRAQAIDEGRAKLIPGDEVLAEMRARLKG